ncbi:hypothetical protein ACFQ9X_17395 [Catenulispora yoronensis]
MTFQDTDPDEHHEQHSRRREKRRQGTRTFGQWQAEADGRPFLFAAAPPAISPSL